MYKDKFVLSIIRDGSPLKESGSKSNKQVVIPFGMEYKIRLKNKNDRDCTARVTIDGSPVSNFGDVIVGAGGTVDLERFITDSMSNGKRFKFVELEHPDVDDPTRSENGLIQVEFRLAKKKDIKIDWNWGWGPYAPPAYPFKENNDGMWYIGTPSIGEDGSGMKCSNTYDSSTVMYCSNNVSHTKAGATVEGGNSKQSFTHLSLDVESIVTTLKLKMVGINNRYTGTQFYCSICGYKIDNKANYCSGCGRRL